MEIWLHERLKQWKTEKQIKVNLLFEVVVAPFLGNWAEMRGLKPRRWQNLGGDLVVGGGRTLSKHCLGTL